jgi:hypothetical protein
MFLDLRNNLKSSGSSLYECSISYSTLKSSCAPRIPTIISGSKHLGSGCILSIDYDGTCDIRDRGPDRATLTTMAERDSLLMGKGVAGRVLVA